MRRTMVTALLLFLMAGKLSAQGAVRSIGSTPVAGDSSKASSTVLPAWKPVKPAVGRTLVEITFINAVAAGINSIARDIHSPTPGTWWDNIQGGWEWDPNMIRVNHLEHPWAGAAYFNAARANGLSFWGSAPMAVTGSLMWELFGEAKPPSINDLLSTSLTGVAMGEPLRQLSLMVLDEEAAGLDRLWREAFTFLVNPGLGLDRLSRGQSWSRRQNPPGRHPDFLRGGLGLGLRQFDRSDGGGFNTPVFALAVDYGDPFAAGSRAPFSSFTASMELLTTSPDGLGSMHARGLVAALGTGDRETTRLGGVFMEFDYRLDGAVEFAQQSFGVGMLSRTELGGGFRLVADVSAEGTPILAVRDRYSKPLTRRGYDYGVGVGTRLMAQLEHRGRRVLWGGGRAYWGPTLDGASATKAVQIAGIDARLPLLGGLSLGGAWQFYRQHSTYDTRPSESERVSSLSLFLLTGD